LDDEFEECELAELYARSAPARKIDWLIVGVNLARRITESVSDALSNAEMLLCGHANHMVDKDIFMDEVRRDIETITNEE
jgi:hypothetical protein